MGDLALLHGATKTDIVAALERLVEKAKAGEVYAMAIATLNADRCFGTEIVVDRDRIALLGAVGVLEHRIREWILNDG